MFFLNSTPFKRDSDRITNVGREDLRVLLCSTTVLHGLQKSLQPDSQKFLPNSLARNAANLLPCLSDGFGFFFLMVKLLGLEPDAR